MRYARLKAALGLTFLAVLGSLATEPCQDDKSPVVTVSERTAEPLLKADRPWEDFCIGYCQVLRDGDKWHLWYNAHDHNYRSDADVYVCYARSTDGVRWEKPALGLHKYGADKDNNILLAGSNLGSVFLDEKGPRNARFKAAAIRLVGGGVVGLWRHVTRWATLGMAAGVEAQLRHRQRLLPRRRHVPTLQPHLDFTAIRGQARHRLQRVEGVRRFPRSARHSGPG